MSKKDYLNIIKTNNSKEIEELNKMISEIDTIINDYNTRKQNCQDAVTKLSADNVIVDDIIKDVPDS